MRGGTTNCSCAEGNQHMQQHSASVDNCTRRVDVSHAYFAIVQVLDCGGDVQKAPLPGGITTFLRLQRLLMRIRLRKG